MNSKLSRPDLIIPSAAKGLETIVEFKQYLTKADIGRQPKSHQDILLKLQRLTEIHKAALDEIGDAVLEYKRLLVLENPTIYVARTTDIKTGKEYLTAKTSWPMKDWKRKEVKIYLGKSSDFDNDTQSPKAKELALVKMRQTLARRMRSGEI